MATMPRDAATHAGQLALAVGEGAAAASGKEDVARRLADLLARELGPATAAWYWCGPHGGAGGSEEPRLKRASATLHAQSSSRARGRLMRSSAEAAATSRHLVLRAGQADEPGTPPDHVMACPLGAPEPVAVLVLAAPATPPETHSHRVAVLTRLLPALALAVQPYAQRREQTGKVLTSGPLTADYLSILSHDLRTPLHTLSGFLEMVHDGMAGPLNELQREFLGYARTGAQQLGAMLEDVLLLSRADSSRLTLRTAQMQVASLLRRVLNTAQSEAEIKRVALVADLPQDLPPLLGDEDRLGHALARLVSHAVERSPSGSTVEIAAAEAADYVTIAVKDTGPLIPMEHGKDLFSYVPRHGANRPSESTYLGLAVARLLVELQGGRVELQCSTEAETIVVATLPSDS
jgi:signal transduction histidine kinase